LTNLFELFELLIYEINLKRIDFFVLEKIIERKKSMINIIKQEIEIDETLKRRLKIICDFCNIKPEIINGSIRKVDKTNLSYIEPHRIIIKNNTFLVFNYSNEIYINNLSKKIKITELENYIKTMTIDKSNKIV